MLYLTNASAHGRYNRFGHDGKKGIPVQCLRAVSGLLLCDRVGGRQDGSTAPGLADGCLAAVHFWRTKLFFFPLKSVSVTKNVLDAPQEF